MAGCQNPQPADNRQDDLENQAQPTLAFHDMMERQRQLIQQQADLDCENRILRGERPPSEEVVDMLSDPEAYFRCLEASIKKMTEENERLKSEQAPKEIVEPNANASTADTQRRKTQYACEGCGTAVWLSGQEAGRTRCIKCRCITVRKVRKG
jgi:hypothetical protein